MQGYNGIFERHEKKYLVSKETFALLLHELSDHLEQDPFAHTLVSSLYFDTHEDVLIGRSMEKPVYKEKIRLRAYGVPATDDDVYVEIKKKFKGVVYKRRVSMRLCDAYDFLAGRKQLDGCSLSFADESGDVTHGEGITASTLRELVGFRERYEKLHPAMFISCSRDAFSCPEEDSLRITFDGDIRWRDDELRLENGLFGARLIDEGLGVMEIKCTGAYPLWLSHALSSLRLYPQSFSKYARAYEAKMAGGVLPPKREPSPVSSRQAEQSPALVYA